MTDLYSRMINSHTCRPHDGLCLEYDKFINNEFPPKNFSHTIMNFFGIHDQYPFDLPNNEHQWRVIENIIDSSLGHEAAAIYRQTVNINDDCALNCSDSNLLNFQHMFAEMPTIIAHQTKQIILQNEIPVPYGYMWDNNTHINISQNS
jgi:hypothetical protein